MKFNNTDMTGYNMARRPSKQYFFLMPLVWLFSWIMGLKFKLKIDKTAIKDIKPPYLVFATHQGFMDYCIGPLALFPHRAMYVSDMEGFAAFGNWLYRGLGCIPKRRFVSDISVVSNIRYALLHQQSVVIYPESRHSNCGTTAYIPDNLGKLAKLMDVPVVVLSANGCYLANPFWDEEHTRTVPIEATLKCICKKEDLETISEEELSKRIADELKYDEYRYQQEHHISIKNRNIEGIHKVLYKCLNCSASFSTETKGSILSCKKCNSSWEMTSEGWLIDCSSKKLIHIPDWYEWERQDIGSQLCDLPLSYAVHLEALPNEHGFVILGNGTLTLTTEEFVLQVQNQVLHFPHKNRESVQTEYNYKGRGSCIVLSNKDCCYYIYSKEPTFNPTWFQFIGEYLYQHPDDILH